MQKSVFLQDADGGVQLIEPAVLATGFQATGMASQSFWHE
ncbi:hypothetical protein SAMN03159448_04787 [Sinorhizobium sp. NFACC03]|nr:hypothetical protein SAMN03159448_04787 [Sinorhizobium sp. NFACC03]